MDNDFARPGRRSIEDLQWQLVLNGSPHRPSIRADDHALHAASGFDNIVKRALEWDEPQRRKIGLRARRKNFGFRAFVALLEVKASVRIASTDRFRIGDGQFAGDREVARRTQEAVADSSCTS